MAAKAWPHVTPQQALRAAAAVRSRSSGLTLRLALEALGQVARQEREEVTLGTAEAVALLEHLRALEAAPAPPSASPDPALVEDLRRVVARGQALLKALGQQP
jgi:hypothetical protein